MGKPRTRRPTIRPPSPAQSWTEARVQFILARHFSRKSGLCVPNCGVWGWESDLIRVTPRLFSAEYEIKVSRADFLADAKKPWKHLALKGEISTVHRIPNYFFYATPPGLISPDDLPDHAGLIEIGVPDERWPVVRRPARRLHGETLSLREVLYITRGVGFRYWKQRESAGLNSAELSPEGI